MRATPPLPTLAALAAALASLSVSNTLSAQHWQANLTPEVAGATGFGTAAFSLSGSMLSISASWSGLSGPTTVAHIHCCTTSPGNVGVAVTPGTLPGFPVGLTAGSYATTIDLSDESSFTASFVTTFAGGFFPDAQAALVSGFDSGQAYFNIHSTAFPGGEIRGVITAVPEPSRVLLLAAGVVMLAAAYRRRRA